MKLRTTKAKRFSKAQILGLAVIQGAMAISVIACLLAPFIVSFGGAYNTMPEYFMLTAKLCWIILSRIMFAASIPFVFVTFLKGLFN